MYYKFEIAADLRQAGVEEMNNKTEEVVTAIGAIAESLGVFLKELERSGFDRGESISLCNTYLRTLLTQNNGGQNE
jgi:hypothetical protein